MTGLGKRDQTSQSVKSSGRAAIKSQSPAPGPIQIAGRQRARESIWTHPDAHLSHHPRTPTHYEPSGCMPGPYFSDPKGRQGLKRLAASTRAGPPAADFGTASPCGGRPYGGPSGALTFGLLAVERRRCGNFFQGHPTQTALTFDKRGMERKATPPAFFTERSLAAYLAVSDRTIRNWIRRGELPSYKLGAARRIDPADVDAFLSQRREEAA
jgi:excisionase family DNA binding protein